jgi:hypothetical protein
MIGEATRFWSYAFGSFFIGMSAIVLITGWLAERRRKRKWEKRCEHARQVMIAREKAEKRYQSNNGSN